MKNCLEQKKMFVVATAQLVRGSSQTKSGEHPSLIAARTSAFRKSRRRPPKSANLMGGGSVSKRMTDVPREHQQHPARK